jgi:hypothetical protein
VTVAEQRDQQGYGKERRQRGLTEQRDQQGYGKERRQRGLTEQRG